jgi:predicted AAA+ superfamily ATPase
MVFLAGPRQVGKTALARRWLESKGCPSLYFNWDEVATRQAYLKNSRFFESPARTLGAADPWIAFDEIHKRSHSTRGSSALTAFSPSSVNHLAEKGTGYFWAD